MKVTLLMLIVSNFAISQTVVARMYFSDFMGHVHKTPSTDSSSLTAVQCAYKVKILKAKGTIEDGWSYVKVGDDIGFIETSRLSSNRPNCFQGKYQDYYNSLNLDLTDLYYLGRLNEQFVSKESKAR